MAARIPRVTGRTAIVTGAGRGVGFETARALASLGAHVVIAEIDEATGARAATRICDERQARAATFVRTDVGDPESLGAMVDRISAERGRIDIVVNNATVTPFGPVAATPLEAWDLSYRVNLRGPVELARLTVPGMVERGYGVFACLSSVGGAFMGPYEALKAAQVELAATLAAEVEGTGVFAFAVGPGQVETPGLRAGVEILAPLYGMTEDEFLALNAAHTIPAEEAGAGIAYAVELAERFHGTETSSIGGLTAWREVNAPAEDIGALRPAGRARLAAQPHPGALIEPAGASAGNAPLLAREVRSTFLGQVRGWRERGVFERKWMERDFRRHAGMSPEEMVAALDALAGALDRGESAATDALERLRGYYDRYEGLARDNTRDPEQLAAALEAIDAWRREIDALREALG